jgi:hypothetical protein
MKYGQHIPVAFAHRGLPIGFIRTVYATGAELALAILYENEHGHYELNDLWRGFRNAGGSAKDCVGMVLRWSTQAAELARRLPGSEGANRPLIGRPSFQTAETLPLSIRCRSVARSDLVQLRTRREGNVSSTRTRLAVLPLALMIGSLISPAYSQNESKTGEGPRGTPVAPSTPSQATSTPQPPPGLAKSGTPVSKDRSEAMGGTKTGKPADSGK